MANRKPAGTLYVRIYDEDTYNEITELATFDSLTPNQWAKQVIQRAINQAKAERLREFERAMREAGIPDDKIAVVLASLRKEP